MPSEWPEPSETTERYRILKETESDNGTVSRYPADTVHTETDCPYLQRGNHWETLPPGEPLPRDRNVYITGEGVRKVGPKWCNWCQQQQQQNDRGAASD